MGAATAAVGAVVASAARSLGCAGCGGWPAAAAASAANALRVPATWCVELALLIGLHKRRQPSKLPALKAAPLTGPVDGAVVEAALAGGGGGLGHTKVRDAADVRLDPALRWCCCRRRP